MGQRDLHCIPGETFWGKAVRYGKRRYERRNRSAIMFGHLKDLRRIATRYDCWPKVFLSATALAAYVIFWLGPSTGLNSSFAQKTISSVGPGYMSSCYGEHVQQSFTAEGPIGTARPG